MNAPTKPYAPTPLATLGHPANTEVVFGALAPPLHEQLGGAATDWEHEQLDANALVRLKIRGYISRSALQVAEKRLVKRICDKLKSQSSQ